MAHRSTALVGSFYLASALTFLWLGLRGDWPAAHGVCLGVLAFTLPTVVATLQHRDLFDWSRWQALAWIAFFVGSPITFSSFLFAHRGRATEDGVPLPGRTRATLEVLGIIYAVLALGLLLSPGRLEDISPFALPGLSGRFLGSWCAFLAVLAWFSLARNSAREARVPLVALLIWPAAAIVAAVRSFDELQPSPRRLMYFAWLVFLAGLAARVRRASRPDG